MIKADLHTHWKTSSKIKPQDFCNLVDTAFYRLGKGGIVGLVDFEDSRYKTLCHSKYGYERVNFRTGIYVPEKEITIVRGQEIPTKQGHILILGLDEEIYLPSGEDVLETIRRAEDAKAIKIADHPFYFEGLGNGLEHILDKLDAIEVYNATAEFGLRFGPLKKGANIEALEYFRSKKDSFPKLGGLYSSDSHNKFAFAKTYSRLEDVSNNLQNFLESLKISLQKHRNFDCDRSNSFIGKMNAVEHILKLSFCLGYKKIKSRVLEN